MSRKMIPVRVVRVVLQFRICRVWGVISGSSTRDEMRSVTLARKEAIVARRQRGRCLR